MNVAFVVPEFPSATETPSMNNTGGPDDPPTPGPPASRIFLFTTPSRSSGPPSVMSSRRTLDNAGSMLHGTGTARQASCHAVVARLNVQYCAESTADGNAMDTCAVAPNALR